MLYKQINVLIIDDSKTICNSIKHIIETNEKIKVVDFAHDGKDGYKKIVEHKPDIIILDINMPVMDGLSLLLFLRKQDVWVKSIILSSLTTSGSRTTIKALNLGALDFVHKPETGFNSIADELIDKIIKLSTVNTSTISKYISPMTEDEIDFEKTAIYKDLANIQDNKNNNDNKKSALDRSLYAKHANVSSIEYLKHQIPDDFIKPKLIVIGVSTGGPKALHMIIPTIPKTFPLPILIAQHMPEGFTLQLASSINNISEVAVKEAVHGEVINPGTVYIAPGRRQMSVKVRTSRDMAINVSENTLGLDQAPSIDYLFNSVEENIASSAIAVLMTGMGSDGAKSLLKLHQKHALTIAQDKESSTVFGMPRVAIELGAAKVVLKLEDIIPFIQEVLKKVR